DLLAAMQSGLGGFRERRPRTDWSQEHVALVEQTGESRTHALPVGGRGEVALDRHLGREIQAGEHVRAVLVAPGREETGAAMRIERLRALDHTECGIRARRLRQAALDERPARAA